MKLKMLSVAALLSCLPTVVSAACLNLYGNIKWEKIDSNEMMLYKRGSPYAIVHLEYGTYLNRLSDVQILDDYPCSYSDNVFLIDGDAVGVRRIEKL